MELLLLKNVKRKVLKRAKWKYLPKFREEEAEKFAGKSNIEF